MKALKIIKFALIVAAMFTFSACELVEEPDFDTTETGKTTTENSDIED